MAGGPSFRPYDRAKAFGMHHMLLLLRIHEFKVGLHPIGKKSAELYLMAIVARRLAGRRADPKPLSPTRDEIMKSLARALPLEALDALRPLRAAGPAAPRRDDLKPTMERK
jgi:hypothetical protein